MNLCIHNTYNFLLAIITIRTWFIIPYTEPSFLESIPLLQEQQQGGLVQRVYTNFTSSSFSSQTILIIQFPRLIPVVTAFIKIGGNSEFYLPHHTFTSICSKDSRKLSCPEWKLLLSFFCDSVILHYAEHKEWDFLVIPTYENMLKSIHISHKLLATVMQRSYEAVYKKCSWT